MFASFVASLNILYQRRIRIARRIFVYVKLIPHVVTCLGHDEVCRRMYRNGRKSFSLPLSCFPSFCTQHFGHKQHTKHAMLLGFGVIVLFQCILAPSPRNVFQISMRPVGSNAAAELDEAWTSLSDVSKDRPRSLPRQDAALLDSEACLPQRAVGRLRLATIGDAPSGGALQAVSATMFATRKPLPSIGEGRRSSVANPQSVPKADTSIEAAEVSTEAIVHPKSILRRNSQPRDLWGEMDGVLTGRFRKASQKTVRWDLDGITYHPAPNYNRKELLPSWQATQVGRILQ